MTFKLIIAHLYFQLDKQRSCKGFTLIELLVVTIVVGILSAIAIPNLIGQVGKAREAEARANLSTIGQAQQAYFVEKGTFANNISELDINLEEGHYSYSNPDLIDTSTVKHKAISLDPDGSSTRNYSLGIYHNLGQFNLILC